MLFRFIPVLSILLAGPSAAALESAAPIRSADNISIPQFIAQADDASGVEGEAPESETPPPSAPRGQDPAGLTTRIDRLERQLRQITGENEELQHKVQTLEEQLRATRPPEPSKNAETSKSDAPRSVESTAKPAEAISPGSPGGPSREATRADAFRPSAAPDAPGAPKPLGAAAPSLPLDIAHGRLVGAQPGTGANDAPMGAALTASTATPGPQQEYDEAIATLKAGRYEAAEQALSAFLAKYPKSKLTPAALYNIGESFFQRGRRREAAEKYLEISSKFSQSPLAPDALLRLGQSLAGLGAKEQACAAFNEIGVKYPAAIGRLRESVERESKKLPC